MTLNIKNALGVREPVITKDKGDLSNRLDWMGESIKASSQVLAKDTVVIGGTAIAAGAVVRNKNFVDKFCNVVSKVTQKTLSTINNVLPKNSRLKNEICKFFNKARTKITGGNLVGKIKTLSGKQKGALGVVIGLGALALAEITNRHCYKKGQIDQKYTDKAAIEKYTKSPLE